MRYELRLLEWQVANDMYQVLLGLYADGTLRNRPVIGCAISLVADAVAEYGEERVWKGIVREGVRDLVTRTIAYPPDPEGVGPTVELLEVLQVQAAARGNHPTLPSLTPGEVVGAFEQ